CWTPTSILAIVPLQRVYPDTGPVTLTMGDQTATGPSFTTEQPGDPAPVPPAAPNPLLGFGPPAWPPVSSTGAGGSPSAPLPTIRELADGNQRPLGAVAREVLFFIQGSGFGTNPLYRSRVLFVTASGDPIDGAVWDWSDDSIAVFAPSVSGPAQVVVQVDANGTPVASNRVPLVIQ